MSPLFMKKTLKNKAGSMPRVLAALVLLTLSALLWQTAVSANEAAVVIPSPVFDSKPEPKTTAKVDAKSAVNNTASNAVTMETAVFAGGCFWGVQGVFQHVVGVNNAVSGYAGGNANTARYQIVGSGLTDHAEAVKITYDPRQISYGQLLHIYFSVVHDPTELNRQGPDSGRQYRSTVFAANAAQQQVATRYIAQLNKAAVFPAPIVTTIETGRDFFPAEDYHQNFLALHPTHAYIVRFDAPKIASLKRVFASQYREKPVLVNVR